MPPRISFGHPNTDIGPAALEYLSGYIAKVPNSNCTLSCYSNRRCEALGYNILPRQSRVHSLLSVSNPARKEGRRAKRSKEWRGQQCEALNSYFHKCRRQKGERFYR